jgi:hypothetical protein
MEYDTVLCEGLQVLRPAVKGMTYPVSELDPISAAIGKVVRARVSGSCQKYSSEESAVSCASKLKVMSLLHRVSSNESVSEVRGSGTSPETARNRRLSFNPLPPRQHVQAEAVGAYEVPQTKRIG